MRARVLPDRARRSSRSPSRRPLRRRSRLIIGALAATAALAAAARAAPPAVTLAPDVAARAGIETTRVASATAVDAIEAFGHVVDPLPFLEALHTRAAARSTATVARAEQARVTRLHRDDQNASTRDLESARAAAERATLALASATARAVLAWGDALEGADALAPDLAAGRAALARIDLPAGAHVVDAPATVRVSAVGRPERVLDARVLGAAPTTDPLLQGDAYLVLVTANPPPPATALRARVPRRHDPVAGVAVPRTAVVWADGAPLAFVATTPGVFQRRPLTLAAPLDAGWLVTDGVSPGEDVVTRGAAQLLSAATLAAEPQHED